MEKLEERLTLTIQVCKNIETKLSTWNLTLEKGISNLERIFSQDC